MVWDFQTLRRKWSAPADGFRCKVRWDSCYGSAREALPCTEQRDAKQPRHSNVRAVCLAERTYSRQESIEVRHSVLIHTQVKTLYAKQIRFWHHAHLLSQKVLQAWLSLTVIYDIRKCFVNPLWIRYGGERDSTISSNSTLANNIATASNSLMNISLRIETVVNTGIAAIRNNSSTMPVCTVIQTNPVCA